MALSGIQIFKFLPGGKKTPEANCKECGCSTCMAFAMKLAKNDINMNLCPHLDEELKALFASENRKPQQAVTFGHSPNELIMGDENVMFRHDKTFVNQTVFAMKLNSADIEFDKKLADIQKFSIDRVGETFNVDAVALFDGGKNFKQTALAVAALEIPLILITDNYENMVEVLDDTTVKNPLIYLKDAATEQLTKLHKEYSCPVVVNASTFENLAEASANLLEKGVKEIVLSLHQEIDSSIIEPLTMIRRSAIEKKYEPLGFPVMIEFNTTGNIALDTVKASALVCKYTGLLIFDEFDRALMTTLITLRQNIYTDPQKPLQVEPKLYEINEPQPNSPVFVTTNFALTYFSVVNELENIPDGSYLVITDSDGMSVLTAWSASKFTGEIIAKSVRAAGLNKKVSHNNLIIPGFASDLLEEIKEELPEFNIICGPNEATDLPGFVKNLGG
ncbi:MAG: acetyl-CoA decarbonylase/synthase complex subunit gamma [Candidatus Gastranaerophilales bacterium]|nr:acetyl-CoA decarbonylase/synthase complex subunit gamma [Candidatus Gastranaerophilales bacterium]